MKVVFGIIILCSLVPSEGSCSETLFAAEVESDSALEKIPSSAIIDAILSDADHADQEKFSSCLKELNIDTVNRHTLFRAVKLPKINPNEKLYFVRPALEPYCHTFYGAHLFRFWLLSERKKIYKILHRGIGDYIEILQKKHHGYYDVLIENWTAYNKIIYRYQYVGNVYKPVVCKEAVLVNEEDLIEKNIPCNN